MFIGRRKELSLLKNAFEARSSALIPIYGRRRIGKSELILKFLEDRQGLYYLGKTAPARVQIKEFMQEAAYVFDEPLLSAVTPTGWNEALLLVTSRWKGEGKLVLVLDEFQWLAGASPELPSVLQELWDRKWQKSGKILLILCGSFVGFMERAVLGQKSPLFGRRTAQILLRPFSFRESAAFHPSWSSSDKAQTYFICGGIPYYLQFFTTSCSVPQNIEQQLLNEFAPLFREPDFLLREELRDVENYYAVLLAIATGNTTTRTIAAEASIPERSLHYYIQQLSDLGYIKRRYPLTDKRATKQSVRYMLEDPLLRFWFKFVFPNLSFLQQMGPKKTFQQRIIPDLDSYFGLCFERVCREALPVIYEREGVNAAFEIGEYWDRSVQIDVVGLRQDGWTDLGECKWGTVRSQKKMLQELGGKVKLYPNRRNATIGLRLFSRKRPPRWNPKTQQARWYDLDDLYHRTR